MNSKDSGLSQSTEEDIGSFIVQTMKTVINQLNALRTDGYIVMLDAKGATSTPSLTVKYAPHTRTNQRTLLSTLETLRTRGWDLNRLNPTSKESLLPFLGSLVGRSSQEVEDTLQAYLYPTSMKQEIKSSSSKSDTQKEAIEDLLLQEVAPLFVTGSNAYQEYSDFYLSQRVAVTQLSYDGQDVLQSPSQVLAVEQCYNDCVRMFPTGDIF